MKATILNGDLKEIEDCYIIIPKPKSGSLKIPMKILPDISDGKGAAYNEEPVVGRSMPMKTFSHGENRTISWTAYFMICKEGDARQNLQYLRAIESAVYPRSGSGGAPYAPPPVCVISCGELLSANKEVCVVLKSYSVKYPTDVAWDEETKTPYKFSVDMSWDIVYMSNDLPGQDRIFTSGS